MAKNVFGLLKPILTGEPKQAMRKKLVKTLIWSMVTYWSETWTPLRTDVRMSKAFEMWLGDVWGGQVDRWNDKR